MADTEALADLLAERDRLRAQVEQQADSIQSLMEQSERRKEYADRLRADVRELVECLGTVIATHEAEAKAHLSCENALSNFDDSNREWKALVKAMRAASDAEKTARTLLAKHNPLQALADNAREMGLSYEGESDEHE